mmetsp:Transcript_8176/g.10687  ORF Transcript_8176/g.10687 Transcript_8176/m.10687 type:complete len:98 (-) Transcript_8176:187-480(-)
MLAIARGVFYLLRFDLVNKFISALVLRARDLNEENKPGAEKLFQVMSIASSVHDKILWRIYSVVYIVRKLIFFSVLSYVFLRRKSKMTNILKRLLNV